MDKNFGGVIWTNHALKRLRERGLKQGDAWATFRRPARSKYAASKRAWVYYRTYGDQRIEVVAKKNEKGEWLILSVWSSSSARSEPVFVKREKSKVKESLWKAILKEILGKRI